MKKFISTILFSLFAVIACAFTVGAGELTASATNDFTVSVTELSADVDEYVKAGDFKVTLYITNNSGVAGGGFAYYYEGSDFEIIKSDPDANDSVVYTTPSSWNTNFVAKDDPAQEKLGFSLAQEYNITANGEMISFYLHPKTDNVAPNPITGFEVDQVRNVNKQLQPYTEPTSYVCSYISTSYVIGDVDGDGLIDSADAIIVMEVVEVDGNRITLAEFNANDPFADYDDVVCIGVVDVDGDNDVDNVDAQKILEYYSTVGILGGTYNGVIGTTGYYYTVVESFNSTNQ